MTMNRDWEAMYKELWCAVWACPLEEFQLVESGGDVPEYEATHINTLKEADADAASGFRLNNLKAKIAAYVDARENHPQVAGEIYRDILTMAGLNH